MGKMGGQFLWIRKACKQSRLTFLHIKTEVMDNFGFIIDTKPSEEDQEGSLSRSRFPVFRKSKFDIKEVEEEKKSKEIGIYENEDEFFGKYILITFLKII